MSGLGKPRFPRRISLVRPRDACPKLCCERLRFEERLCFNISDVRVINFVTKYVYTWKPIFDGRPFVWRKESLSYIYVLEDYRLNGKIGLEGRNLNPNKWCKM